MIDQETKQKLFITNAFNDCVASACDMVVDALDSETNTPRCVAPPPPLSMELRSLVGGGAPRLPGTSVDCSSFDAEKC